MSRDRLTKYFILCLTTSLLLTSGCSGDNAELDKLKKENLELKARLEKLEKIPTNTERPIVSTNLKKTDNGTKENIYSPVSVSNIRIEHDILTQIYATFKNVSSKTIDGIDFNVLLFDNFGRPVDSSSNGTNNVVDGLYQEKIAPLKSKNGSWELYLYDQAQKGKIIIKQVHFADGTTWENPNYESELTKEKGKL